MYEIRKFLRRFSYFYYVFLYGISFFLIQKDLILHVCNDVAAFGTGTQQKCLSVLRIENPVHTLEGWVVGAVVVGSVVVVVVSVVDPVFTDPPPLCCGASVSF